LSVTAVLHFYRCSIVLFITLYVGESFTRETLTFSYQLFHFVALSLYGD